MDICGFVYVCLMFSFWFFFFFFFFKQVYILHELLQKLRLRCLAAPRDCSISRVRAVPFVFLQLSSSYASKVSGGVSVFSDVHVGVATLK